MSGSFKNKVFSLEFQPSPEVWDIICERLDAEYVAGDAVVSAKLDEATVPPPTGAWDTVQSALHPALKVRFFPLYNRRLAIAVILGAVLSATAMYVFNGSPARNDSGRTGKLKALITLKTILNQPLSPSPAKVIALKPSAQQFSNVVSRQNTMPRNRDFVKMNAALAREKYLSGIHTVSALQQIAIPAKPILNTDGCIVMDMNLICNSNDHYITVTGPNGSQTKISNKFLSWLSSMNTEVSEDNTDNVGVRWKETFQSWRNKLLHKPSFIPAASNFFDIFEMKDMILEQ